jgi:SRSO17 transposase
VNNAPWSDERLLAKVCEQVLPAIERHGPVEAWIIDDTSFRKKGHHSVGVAVQYCGAVGKKENCQVAVTLSIANHGASLPIAYRLYLPQDWATDADRRRKAGVPETIEFATKTEIALAQVRAACAAGIPRGVVLMDHAYGSGADFRASLSALALNYVAAINPQTSVWAPDTEPLPAKPWSGRGGRPSRRLRRDADHRPTSVKELALQLPKRAWRTIKWREGSADWLKSRFACIRVRPARGDDRMAERRAEEWLLIEWPRGENEPTNYWLSNLPADITFERLVDYAKLRWRIERDYQELKQEIGLAHFEGRGWRGFHHHASLCIAAYGFLISERETIPPSGPRSTTLFPAPALPPSYRPRGSAIAA